ncbi:MAG: hypothetical protein E7468_00985 [Ruminococcaceae bacterium]|nr:hypothetical protein [Oscillospiraceae bacterium]
MLRILLSKDWVACRNEILSCIARDVAQRKPGRILMVPELISHDVERRLCKAAGDTASRFAEVLSFSRLASRVADRVGNSAMQCLDDGGRIVAMAAATRQLHSQLKAYAAVETKPEFLKELVDAVDEFKRCCISAEDLRHAASQTEGTLTQKLNELALILESYDALCAQGRRDPRDQMTWCLEQLEEDSFASEHVFYIDGFPDFTRQHLAILEHLIRNSPMVTVGINCDQLNSSALAFEKAANTVSQLIQCAHRADIDVEIQTLDGRDDVLLRLCEGLFQGKLPNSDQLSGRVRAVRADSIQSEVNAAADRIMELVRSGCRYRDISIVCGDMASYENVLRLVMGRCNIPIYQAGTEDILHKTVVATVLSAMEAALGGFEQRSVLRYLKSILSPLDQDTCDKVENYVITWGIRGSQFLKSWERNPDGFGKEMTVQNRAELADLNAARELALQPLEQLHLSFKSAKNLAEQVQSLIAFLDQIRLLPRLELLEKQMAAAGRYRDAQILSQLWEILLTALEQMHDTLGQTVWEPETFTRLLTLLLSQYTVGTIPPVLDAVTVGPVSAQRCQEAKHLLVLGADEGALPGYGGSKGLLTDQERVLLREMGVPLTGGAIEGLQAEFAEIYGVFCGAFQSIWISHCDAEGSYLYRRIARAVGGEEEPSLAAAAAASDARETGAYLARWQNADAATELGVEDWYCDTRQRLAYELGNVTPEGIRTLYGNKLNLSASQVDRHAECRLSYFLKYGLRAKERKEYTVDPAEFGTYVHDVLEHTAKEVMSLGGFEAVSLEQTIEIARKHSDDYAAANFAQLDSLRLDYLFRRNWRELEMVVQELWQELKDSQFRPEAFELAFGDDGEMPAIDVQNAAIHACLQGFVDRVDLWKNGNQHYFRVVDYKTGKKDFDYCDVFNGVGLQMLLYLFALEMSDYGKAAGVQYFPARVPLVSADGRVTDEEAQKMRQKEWKRKGLLLFDEEVLQAMEPGEEMSRLCCTRKKDGSLTGDLADREQLKLLRQYVFGLLTDMVNEIASGNITPNPYTRGTSHNACTYCPYGSICHQAQVEGRRNYKTMPAQKFWEEVEKEVDRRG